MLVADGLDDLPRGLPGAVFMIRYRLACGFAVVLFLALSAEGDVAGGRTIGHDAAGKAQLPLSAGVRPGFSYANWLRHKHYYDDNTDSNDTTTIAGGGSFWSDVASQFSARFDDTASRRAQEVLPDADGVRGWIIDDGGAFHFDGWRESRREEWRQLPSGFLGDAEQSFADSLADAAQRRLGFVRRARVDLQTSLGGRKAQGALDAAGALHETTETLLAWQLRGFAAAADRGGNVGVFYRFVHKEDLLGFNVFADYHNERDAGGFWRWSAGGEYQSRYGGFSANYYDAISDSRRLPGDIVAYTRGGWDAEVALRAPMTDGVYAHLGYYRWRGEYGDDDESGLRWGLSYAPGDDLAVKVEYDAEAKRWGGKVSYTRIIGVPEESRRQLSFDPRAHFFDAVRREYGQRIGKARIAAAVSSAAATMIVEQSGAEVHLHSDALSAVIRPGPPYLVLQRIPAIAELTTLTISGAFANYPAPLDEDITISIGGGGSAVIRHRQNNWRLTLQSETQAAFRLGASLLAVESGAGVLRWAGAPFWMMASARLTMTLGGGGLVAWDFSRTAPTMRITLFEGGITTSGGGGFTMLVLNDSYAVVDGAGTVSCADGALRSLPNVQAYCGQLPVVGAAVVVPAYRMTAVATITAPPPASFGGEPVAVSLASPRGIFDLHNYTAGKYALSITVSTLSGIGLTADIRVRDEGGAFFALQMKVPVSIARDLGVSARAFVMTSGMTATAALLSGRGGVPPYRFALSPPSPAWTMPISGALLFDGTDAAGEWLLTVRMDDVIGSHQAAAAFVVEVINPPPLTLRARNVVSLLIVGGDNLAAVLSASGGAGDYVYGLTGGGDAAGLRLGLDNASITLYAEGSGVITLTASVNDNHSATSPASLSLTITITSGLFLRQVGDSLLLTARADRGDSFAIATVTSIGGGDSYTYSLPDAPSYLNIHSLGGGASAHIVADNRLPDAPSVITFSAQVNSPNAPGGRENAITQLTLTVVNPPLGLSSNQLLSTLKLGVLDSVVSLSVSGGSDAGFSVSVAGVGGASMTAGIVDKVLRVFGVSAGIATITIGAEDDSANTTMAIITISFATSVSVNKAAEFIGD
ncbi:MAG: inverse autotransporter beta domain-containing protein, partial [Gammaproteobacteria bacterium]